MNCKDCDRDFAANFTLPNGDRICPLCLYKRHLQLMEDFDRLLNDFIDFLIKKQEFIREFLNGLHKM